MKPNLANDYTTAVVTAWRGGRGVGGGEAFGDPTSIFIMSLFYHSTNPLKTYKYTEINTAGFGRQRKGKKMMAA
jgi:hypothetical protein